MHYKIKEYNLIGSIDIKELRMVIKWNYFIYC